MALPNVTQGAGFTIWLTGLSGAGKTTLARGIASAIRDAGRRVEVLDGDEIRAAISPNLGFERADREANILRVGFIANLLARNGVVAIAAVIAPYASARQAVRGRHAADRVPYLEVFVDCSLDELERRDPKQLYRRAREGEIKHMTGIDDPYEPPASPELRLRTDQLSEAECVVQVMQILRDRSLLQ